MNPDPGAGKSALRVAVAEDEPLARERLIRLLQEAGCDIAADLTDGLSLLAWLKGGHAVDALFVDVHMPGASAFEALTELGPDQPLPPLVFVSAFPEHALRAFDVMALDYLLKPVSPERLEQTLCRLRAGAASRAPGRESVKTRNPRDRFPAKAGEGHVILDLQRVSHFEVIQDKVWAWVKGTKYRTTWRSLAEVEDAFSQSSLLRIQRHLLLRSEAVLAVKPLFGGRACVRVGGGIDLDVSRDAFRALKEILGL
jgi:two-component system LytT family response regulator/two-component system response regulator AlgR